MSLAALRKRQKKALEQAQADAKSQAKGNFEKDQRFWELSRDKAGEGSAVIRFLPPTAEETSNWARIYSHGFEGKNGWFIENCPTTIKGDCPVCDLNRETWSDNDEDQKIVRERKRKLSYISNILVVDDPMAPENNGKVFLFRYGAHIFEKIEEKLFPNEKLKKKAMNPFDLWEGADFNLIAVIKHKFVNYKDSEFGEPGAVAETDKEIEAIYKQVHPLTPFIADDQFKSYEDLEQRLEKALTGSKRKTAVTTNNRTQDLDTDESEDLDDPIELSDDEAKEVEDLLDGLT